VCAGKDKMEAIKKQRRILRMAFTKALNTFTSKMEGDCSREDKQVAFQLLEMKMTELEGVHTTYNLALFDSDMAETDVNKELESDDLYKTQYLTAKIKMAMVMISTPEVVTRTVTNATRMSKLPKLELPKFNGNIKDWFPFWSQFKKINDDSSVSNEDKMQYLQRVMVPDSRAHELVKSFSLREKTT